MATRLSPGNPTLIIRRRSFERAGLERAMFDEKLGLTDEEFRVESGLVCIGPIHDDAALTDTVSRLEELGLEYFEDFFDMSGNWPDWLSIHVMEHRAGA